ncbi:MULTISPECIES: hypothetical protein [Providencia]|uniref:Uncharacterized protein n=1 Tax=Providencia huaxiensis TaxID=2027290 RepID=A0A8I2AI67_9GAMM|nr:MULTISPECIES: hypothetical protein [Providencia]MBQ0266744.1 hypothetical protein [Providencia huaxiensis]MCG5290824.1 hypothetical protein [Providencia rettgeri]
MSIEDSKCFSPKEFMKDRRPERFSDSVIVESSVLDRPILEHYISSLNARSQELEFEGFAKKLCEKIICPNLLAQTGPVAGGDGKTDTQTFPVSEQNSLLWYEGINDTSHKERWAFAVSTRKDWKIKCKQDVRKIKESLTGYSKVFCITNQYAKSNQRSDLEGELSKETNLDVRILDINWILDQIFKNNFQYIAIEELAIKTSYKSEFNLGYNDYKKKIKYDELNQLINKKINPSEITIKEVSLFLDCAILSAELENPIHETHSQFLRAIKIAKKFGTVQQMLEAYYQYAWKSHFWLEDFETFEENLNNVYKTINLSSNSSKWEYLVNLVSVNKAYLRTTGVTPSIDIESIEKDMLEKLNLIGDDSSRPSNAMYAKTQILIYQLQNTYKDTQCISIFENLLNILKESTSLFGYPFVKMFNLLTEVDMLFNENPAYENLLDFITEQYSIREGEIRSAELQLKRGIKRLSSGKYFESIKIIGKSLGPLYKKESSDQFILALKVCSYAYENTGLLWSARACMILAASMLTDDYYEREELNAYQIRAYNNISWLELKLGRLGYALKWLELSMIVKTGMGEQPIDENDHQNMDAFISQIILNTDHSILKEMSNFSEWLDHFVFFASSGNLIFALGHVDTFQEQYNTVVDEELTDYLIKLRDFNFGIKPRGINHSFEKRCTYSTNISGCRIAITFPNRAPFLDFSTSLLSILEGAFATCFVDNLYPKEASLAIDISADDDTFSISHEKEDYNGQLTINLMCSGFDELSSLNEYQEKIQDWSRKFVLDILPEIFIFNSTAQVEKMLLHDGALERLSLLSAGIFASKYVLGENIDNEVNSLFSKNNNNVKYELIRDKPWDFNYPKISPSLPDLKLGKGKIPSSLKNNDTIRHDDFYIQNLIKPRLWDLAKWNGVAFLHPINNTPGLCLMFENKNNGMHIFEDLISKVGINDDNGRIKITILKGISTANPAHYRMIISESFNRLSSHKRMTMISRIHTMTPDKTENIDRFIEDYNKVGMCFFGCNSMITDIDNKDPERFGILIKNINVKWAWQIEQNDPDIAALKPNDVIYIPDGVDPTAINSILDTIKSWSN